MPTMKTILLLSLLILLPTCQVLGAAPRLGFVIGWGNDGAGQATGIPTMILSNGVFATTGSLLTTGAVTISGKILNDAVAIAGGMSHGLAVRTDGTVIGWGGNLGGEAVGFETKYPYRTNGQVRIGGQILSNVTAVAAGRTESFALKRDGTVVGWGKGALSDVPAGLTNVIAISAGRGFVSHGVALKRDGFVAAWGQGNPPPTGLSNVVAIAASDETGANVALKADGTVVEWAVRGVDYVSTVPDGLSNVVAVSAGGGQRLALKRDGTVIGWGNNGAGEATGIPTKESRYQSRGDAVKIGSQVLSNVVAIAAGQGYSLALKTDGTVAAWGRMNNELEPAMVPAGLSNVVAIAAGDNFCLTITTNRAVVEHFRR